MLCGLCYNISLYNIIILCFVTQDQDLKTASKMYESTLTLVNVDVRQCQQEWSRKKNEYYTSYVYTERRLHGAHSNFNYNIIIPVSYVLYFNQPSTCTRLISLFTIILLLYMTLYIHVYYYSNTIELSSIIIFMVISMKYPTWREYSTLIQPYATYHIHSHMLHTIQAGIPYYCHSEMMYSAIV